MNGWGELLDAFERDLDALERRLADERWDGVIAPWSPPASAPEALSPAERNRAVALLDRAAAVTVALKAARDDTRHALRELPLRRTAAAAYR